MSSRPRRVVFLYAPEDQRPASRLYLHTALIRRFGKADIWHPGLVLPGTDEEAEVQRRVQEAEVVLLLVSPAFFAAAPLAAAVELALRRQRRDRAVVIPVLLCPVSLETTPLLGLRTLPSDGRPISTWSDEDAAWVDVTRGLMRVVQFASLAEDEALTSSEQPDGPPAVIHPLHRIFSWTGVPALTYVAPEQLGRIRHSLETMREGLVIEGPSGIGKTTAVKKALEELGITHFHRLVGTDADVRAKLQRLREGKFPASGGHLIIDDFHRIDADTQREIANLMKFVTDEHPEQAMVTLVGINPVGETLLRGDPDLAGRYETVLLGKQPDEKIGALIAAGERIANVRFRRREQYVALANGSFFTAQLLCYEAAVYAGLRETATELRVIQDGPQGPPLDRVLAKLAHRFHDLLVTFATCDERSPPRGAGLVLLWLLAHTEDSKLSLDVARGHYPRLQAAFGWMMLSNLHRRFEDFPRLRDLLYYNRDTMTLSSEDPRLIFYLRNLDWEAFVQDTRHSRKEVAWDVSEGPIIAPFDGHEAPRLSVAPPLADLPSTTLLHLSDLHFQDRRQAAQWFDQLVDDLKRELQVDELDAVVLSGDITDRARARGYEAAQQFLADLKQEYRLTPEQFVLVPGNHDMSRDISQEAYDLCRREERQETVQDSEIIDGGGPEIRVRNAERYRQRFSAFASFYRAVRPDVYPMEEDQQFTLHYFPSKRLLLLGLNSAWELDHHYQSRASINGVALGFALRQLRTTAAYQDCLKLAVWHHPIHSAGEDRIRDTGFLERLAKAGFRFGLHGHIHEAQPGLFRNDMSYGGRRIDLLGAGTFGAAGAERPPGIPLQYQLLRVHGNHVRIETRRREKDTGAWKPDTRWEQGPRLPALAHYDVTIGP